MTLGSLINKPVLVQEGIKLEDICMTKRPLLSFVCKYYAFQRKMYCGL